jgi:hypothetical protein
VLAFIAEAGALSVVITDRIVGCPHEEGIDYQGPTCPAGPFWAGRDRWTGQAAALARGTGQNDDYGYARVSTAAQDESGPSAATEGRRMRIFREKITAPRPTGRSSPS